MSSLFCSLSFARGPLSPKLALFRRETEVETREITDYETLSTLLFIFFIAPTFIAEIQRCGRAGRARRTSFTESFKQLRDSCPQIIERRSNNPYALRDDFAIITLAIWQLLHLGLGASSRNRITDTTVTRTLAVTPMSPPPPRCRTAEAPKLAAAAVVAVVADANARRARCSLRRRRCGCTEEGPRGRRRRRRRRSRRPRGCSSSSPGPPARRLAPRVVPATGRGEKFQEKHFGHRRQFTGGSCVLEMNKRSHDGRSE